MSHDRIDERPSTWLVDAAPAERLRRASRDWPSWDLTARQLADLELILTGGYRPVGGFMSEADWKSWKRNRTLADGSAFPAPVRLAVSDALASQVGVGQRVVLRDAEGVAIAIITVSDRWRETPKGESDAGSWYLAGKLEGLQLPTRYDFVPFRLEPGAVQREIERRGWRHAIAFPTTGYIHRAEFERLRAAIERIGGGVVILAVMDPERSDFDEPYFRLRALRAILPRFERDSALLWIVSPAMGDHLADAVAMQALVARNAGCTHILLSEGAGDRELVERIRGLGIDPLAIDPPNRGGGPSLDIERHLAAGGALPADATFPEVARELAAKYPPAEKRGLTIFFTGLSGSGKSTIAAIVRARLLERGGRRVTLLDGDLVRKQLSSELGFNRAHRELNIRRIAFVASEITKNGGIAICSPIAPYDALRREARRMIESVGGFVLVFVDTPLEICEARDRKGLYAKARAGLIREFTGISDTYERPEDAEIVIRTEEESAVQGADRVLAYLEHEGYLLPEQ